MINWEEEIWYCGKLASAVISKSFKRTWVSLNLGSSEDELFIKFNKKDYSEEMMGEINQTANYEFEETV